MHGELRYDKLLLIAILNIAPAEVSGLTCTTLCNCLQRWRVGPLPQIANSDLPWESGLILLSVVILIKIDGTDFWEIKNGKKRHKIPMLLPGISVISIQHSDA